jgi:fatty-acyl-CoA synthase
VGRERDRADRAHAGFKTPKRALVQDDPLPRTATGKVQKLVLVKRYGQAGS